jgi:type IV secretory pathway TrbF-like protein
MTLPHVLTRFTETANGRSSAPIPSLSAPAVPSNPDPAYIRGRAEFASVFGDLAKGKRNWQLAAFGALGVAGVLAFGVVTLATTSRITPYVVEVDNLGRTQSVGPAERLGTVDQRVIVSQLAGFVRDIRTVLADHAAQADLVRRAYAYVDQGAAPFLSAYYAAPVNDPRLLGRELTRLVTVTSVLPLPAASGRAGATTWKIAWTETAIPRAAGGAPTEAAWEGYFTTRIVPPATVERITLNPLGLYVTSINWTQLAKAERRSPDESLTSSPTGVVP